LQRPVCLRDLITRDASRSQISQPACLDEHDAATSHGGIVSILNEPGHFVRCENGGGLKQRSGSAARMRDRLTFLARSTAGAGT
jgi:hypothetical protein